MQIEYKRPEELKDYSNNPRNISDAIEPVAESIRQFGFLVPVLIDKQDVIITGHVRKVAAVNLGLKEIPCIYVDNLSDEQIQAFRLIDNRSAEFSTWDFEKLSKELDDIVDFMDLEVFCFPDFGDELSVNDEDFFVEHKKSDEKKEKVIMCPHCGKEITL